MTKFAAIIYGNKNLQCCGIQEVHGYRIGEVHESDEGRYMRDAYHGSSYLRFYEDAAVAGTRQEATKQCVKAWLKKEREWLIGMEDSIMGGRRAVRVKEDGYSTCRVFNILYFGSSNQNECHTPELRDELMKIECKKTVIGYVNANSGNYIETILLVLDKETRYDGEYLCG